MVRLTYSSLGHETKVDGDRSQDREHDGDDNQGRRDDRDHPCASVATGERRVRWNHFAGENIRLTRETDLLSHTNQLEIWSQLCQYRVDYDLTFPMFSRNPT